MKVLGLKLTSPLLLLSIPCCNSGTCIRSCPHNACSPTCSCSDARDHCLRWCKNYKCNKKESDTSHLHCICHDTYNYTYNYVGFGTIHNHQHK
ncbi:hypothetical protein AMTRI_Chr03g49640 [Amborella trichopoda]